MPAKNPSIIRDLHVAAEAPAWNDARIRIGISGLRALMRSSIRLASASPSLVRRPLARPVRGDDPGTRVEQDAVGGQVGIQQGTQPLEWLIGNRVRTGKRIL